VARARQPAERRAATAHLVVQDGHTGSVKAVALSPDGRLALTGGEDGHVCLWDVATGRQIRQFTGHRGEVSAVTFSPDGRFVLAGLRDAGYDRANDVQMWDTATGECVRRFRSGEEVSGFQYSADGRFFIVDAFSAAVFDAAGGSKVPVAVTEGGNFTADGKHLLVADHTGAVLYEAATWKALSTFAEKNLSAAAVSLDGTAVLTVSLYNDWHLWDTKGGERWKVKVADVGVGNVRTVAFSPDGRSVAAIGSAVSLRDAANGRLVWSSRDVATHLSFSPDGQYLLWYGFGDECHVRKAATGAEALSLKGCTSAAFSADGHSLLAGEGERARLYDLNARASVRTFEGLTEGSVNCGALSPDGRWLALCREDSADLWDLGQGLRVRTMKVQSTYVTALAFSPDSRLLLSGGGSSNDLDLTARLFDVATGREVWRAPHDANILHVAFSPDGRTAATVTSRSQVNLWDVATGARIRIIKSDGTLGAIAFLPAGPQLVTSEDTFDGKGSRLVVRNVTTGWQARELIPPRKVSDLSALTLSPDSKLLAAGARAGAGPGSISAELWEVASGKPLVSLAGHGGEIKSAAFSADGRFLLTASEGFEGQESSVRLWNLDAGVEVRRFVESAKPVTFAAFSPDSRLVITAGRDGPVLIFSSATGDEVCRLASWRSGGWAVVSPQGLFDAGGVGALDKLLAVTPDAPLRPLRATELAPGGYVSGLLPRLLRGVEAGDLDNLSTGDQAILGRLVKQFFERYDSEDLPGFLALWKGDTPDELDQRDELQADLKDKGPSDSRPTILFMEHGADDARAVVEINVAAGEAATGAAPPLTTARMILRLKRAGRGWRVWRFGTEREDLATRLIESPDAARRGTLLNEEAGLVGAELVGLLLARGEKEVGHLRHKRAAPIFDAAVEVASATGSPAELARSHMARGSVKEALRVEGEALADYQEALTYYLRASNVRGAAEAHFKAGSVSFDLGRFEVAQREFQESAALYRELKDEAAEAQAQEAAAEVTPALLRVPPEHRLKVYFSDGSRVPPPVSASNVLLTEAVSRADADVLVEMSDTALYVKRADGEPLARFQFDDRLPGSSDDRKLLQTLLSAWRWHYLRSLPHNAGEQPSDFELRLTPAKASYAAGDVVIVEVRSGLASQPYVYLLQLDDTGTVKPLPCSGSTVPQRLTAGGQWQRLCVVRLRAPAGSLTLRAFATPRRSDLPAESRPLEWVRPGEGDRLGLPADWATASVTFELKYDPLEVLKRSMKSYGDAYVELMGMRSISEMELLSIMLRAGSLGRTEELRQPDAEAALKGVTAALRRRGESNAAVLFYSYETTQRKEEPEDAQPDDDIPRPGTLHAWLVTTRGIAAYQQQRIYGGQLEDALTDMRNALSVTTSQTTRRPRARGAQEEDVQEEGVSGRPQSRGGTLPWAERPGGRGRRREVSLAEATSALSRLMFPRALAGPLKSVETLIVVPALGIGAAPFPVLRLAPNEPMLVEKMAVRIAPSLFDAFKLGQAQRVTFLRPLIVGNPLLLNDPDWQFPNLEGAEREAERVGRMLRARPLLRDQATGERAESLARSADLLYFATHSMSDPEWPLSGSFLALSGPRGKVERWTAGEIQRTRLRARLAVLSACQTGLGVTQDAGLIGLARAFHLAGVPQVVMSLWNVNDQATAALMEKFMANLRAGLPPPEALRRAMLKVRVDYPEPANWASFVVFGI
jgi:WD40 repeat protein/tetratricopeptide (TPR) repeat protein